MEFTKYRTLSQVVNQLRERGFTKSFDLEGDMLRCLESGVRYKPDDLEIIEHHRFEGNSNPADMSIVFVVKCKDSEKGTVISSYGAYGNDVLLAFMNEVEVINK